MTKHQNFIETKEYKRFAEFCDACIKYQYIGICYGQPGKNFILVLHSGILLKSKLIIRSS